MAACPRCTTDLPSGFGSVCPSCGLVIRVPGIVKLAVTILGVGFVVAVMWALGADSVFAFLWAFVESLIVRPLGLQPPRFELTGSMKWLYDFTFGTATEPPWGGILLILAGVVVGGIGGAVLRRVEARGSASP